MDEYAEKDPVYCVLSKADIRRHKRARKNERYRRMQSVLRRASNIIKDVALNPDIEGLNRLKEIDKEIEDILQRIQRHS